MRKARQQFALGLGAVVVASTLVASPASAHSVATFFDPNWEVDLVQDWRFTSGFPTGDPRSRVHDGVAEWNNRNQPMEFDFQSGDVANWNPGAGCPTQYKNDVHWRSIDGDHGTLAETWVCVFGSDLDRMWSANIIFDNAEDWYWGTGDASDGLFGLCIPSCQIDGWSVASHEWGHAVGFTRGPNTPPDGHYDPNESICDDNSSKHTMCGSYDHGTERQRSLESHDIHTFEAAY